MLRSLSQRAGTSFRAAHGTHSNRTYGAMAAAAFSHPGTQVICCRAGAHSLTIGNLLGIGEKGFTKIKVKNSIVDLDGDEMTRYRWLRLPSSSPCRLLCAELFESLGVACRVIWNDIKKKVCRYACISVYLAILACCGYHHRNGG